jgi:2-keto-3-deoxy-L-rhamnonate aldolase RhmA
VNPGPRGLLKLPRRSESKSSPPSTSSLLAKSAGYDTLFIDHEHSSVSVKEASQIYTTTLTTDITPFVRVPYECCDGYVQKILDAGAMGVIFPHVNSAEDARRLSRVCKHPPLGTRSWTNGLPHLGFEVKVLDIIAEADTGYLSTHS